MDDEIDLPPAAVGGCLSWLHVVVVDEADQQTGDDGRTQ